MPNVRTMKFDLRDDIPSDVGHVFAGKTVKKIYSQEHVPAILDCLAKKLMAATKAASMDRLDVLIYGFAPEQILMMIAADLIEWEGVESLWYGHPHAPPMKIFPLDE